MAVATGLSSSSLSSSFPLFGGLVLTKFDGYPLAVSTVLRCLISFSSSSLVETFSALHTDYPPSSHGPDGGTRRGGTCLCACLCEKHSPSRFHPPFW